MNTACLAWVVIVAVSNAAAQICNIKSIQDNTSELPMRHCIASCLDLMEISDDKRQPCYYNLTSGKSKGCGKPAMPNTKKKVLICDAGHVLNWGATDHLKPCDMMYFPVINFTYKSDKISAMSDATETLQNAPKLRKLGIKVIAHLLVSETAENVMRISGNATLRKKFAASVIAVMEQLQLDGFYFQWFVPGCPRGGDCRPSNPHKKYTVELITEMGKSLKSSGRVLILFIVQSLLVMFHLGDYFSEVMPYVDYFILESNYLITHTATRADFNFSLKMTTVFIHSLINGVKDRFFSRRLLLSFNVNVMAFQLINPTDEKIGVEHVQGGTKYSPYLALSDWCELVRPDSGYKVVQSNGTQNYAVKGDHLFVYDDVRSLKEKLDWFNSIGGGAHIYNTWSDDYNNKCGCGRLPFLRTVADLIKSTDCDPMTCF